MDRKYWEYLSEITGHMQEYATILSLENKSNYYTLILSCFCDEMLPELDRICEDAGLKYDYFPHSHSVKKAKRVMERPSVKFLFTEQE